MRYTQPLGMFAIVVLADAIVLLLMRAIGLI